jgi:hypothetical protein
MPITAGSPRVVSGANPIRCRKRADFSDVRNQGQTGLT